MRTRILAASIVAVLIAVAVLWRASAGTAASSGLSLVPMPAKVTEDKGSFRLEPKTAIVVSHETQALGGQLLDALRKPTGYAFELRTAKQPWETPGSIVFQLTSANPAGAD